MSWKNAVFLMWVLGFTVVSACTDPLAPGDAMTRGASGEDAVSDHGGEAPSNIAWEDVLGADQVAVEATPPDTESSDASEALSPEENWCYGTARVTQEAEANYAFSRLENGTIRLALMRDPSGADIGERFWVLSLEASLGVWWYPPNSGLARCEVVERTTDGLQPISEIGACEVLLGSLEFSTEAGECEGYIEGIFAGTVEGGDYVAGSFTVPLAIREDELAR